MSAQSSSDSRPKQEDSSSNDPFGIITVTMNEIPGYRIVRTIGVVSGLTVNSRNWGADLASLVKSAVGGELKMFTTMVYKARNIAVERMVGECIAKGGNAVIAFRFDTSDMGVCVQTCAYGTACVIEKTESGGTERSL